MVSVQLQFNAAYLRLINLVVVRLLSRRTAETPANALATLGGK